MPKWRVRGLVTWTVTPEVVVEAENEDEAAKIAVREDLLAEAAAFMIRVGDIDDEEIEVEEVLPVEE